ncbi:hypothetical protein Sjap_009486 [Stephania japonica]|uniref:Uncharacterized protein n=1 Tax=Stephania japonica TaxID=461633 RepID=A0AAP0PCB2_9MAGN
MQLLMYHSFTWCRKLFARPFLKRFLLVAAITVFPRFISELKNHNIDNNIIMQHKIMMCPGKNEKITPVYI